MIDRLRLGWFAARERTADRLDTVSAIVLWGAVLVALPTIGFVGVVAAESIPDRLVIQPLYDAYVDGDLRAVDYERGITGNMVDRFSECKRMTVGLGDRAGDHPIESALASPTLGPCTSAVPKIVGWAEGNGLDRAYLYTRYWNGSAVVLRPAIAVFGLVGTRVAAAVVLIASAAVFWRRLQRYGGRPVALACLAPLVLTTDLLDLPAALLHSVAWIALLLTSAAALAFGGRRRCAVGAAGMFACGAAFLYVGDMASPDAAWALTTTAFAVGAARLGRAQAWWRVPVGGLAWIGGFAWMWMSKWVLGAFVVGFDVMRDNVTTQIEGRLSGEGDGVDQGIWSGLGRNWEVWWRQPLTGVVVVACGAAIVVAALRRQRADVDHDTLLRLTIAAPALIPIVWMTLLRNHSQVHAFFVYRSLAVGLAAVTVAGVAVLDGRVRRPGEWSGVLPAGRPAVDAIDQGA